MDNLNMIPLYGHAWDSMLVVMRTTPVNPRQWRIPRKPLTSRPPRQKLMRKTPVKNEIVKVLWRGIPLTTVPRTPCQSTVSCGNGWAHLMVPHEHADPLTPCQSTVTCGNGCASHGPARTGGPVTARWGCQDRGIHPTALPGPGPVTAPGNKSPTGTTTKVNEIPRKFHVKDQLQVSPTGTTTGVNESPRELHVNDEVQTHRKPNE